MNMKPLTLETAANVTGGRFVGDEALKSVCITSVIRDSRAVTPGSLFLCIPGAKADGHDFAGRAYAAGAVCCIAEREFPDAAGPYILVESTLSAVKKLGAYYRSLFPIPVVGVTGSVGKTTAKEMIAAVLSEKYRVLKTSENLNNELGVPLTLLSLREEHEAAVIEMGISEFGEMSRLAEMARPDICVMTVIGCCHLENLGDLDGVLRAKGEVFRYMKPDSVAVLNGDDEKLKAFDPGVRKVTFGFGAENDFVAFDMKNLGFDGVSFSLKGPALSIPDARIPAFGQHLVSAALAAAAVGRLLGLTGEEIARGFLRYAPVGGRANVISTGPLTIIDDCYNANPDSVRASLSSLAMLGGRKTAILGDMNELGKNTEALHRETGVFAAGTGIDLTVCCGALAKHIADGCAEHGGNTLYFPDKEMLLAHLGDFVRPGDTVLVKASHSHHFEEIVRALRDLK